MGNWIIHRFVLLFPLVERKVNVDTLSEKLVDIDLLLNCCIKTASLFDQHRCMTYICNLHHVHQHSTQICFTTSWIYKSFSEPWNKTREMKCKYPVIFYQKKGWKHFSNISQSITDNIPPKQNNLLWKTIVDCRRTSGCCCNSVWKQRGECWSTVGTRSSVFVCVTFPEPYVCVLTATRSRRWTWTPCARLHTNSIWSQHTPMQLTALPVLIRTELMSG